MEISIGKTIKKLRTDKGVTQEELAKYLNITFQSVSKWETEAAVPDTMLLPKIAIFFGVSIDDLFTVGDINHFQRVDEILYSDDELSESSFLYVKRYLIGLLEENSLNTEALKRLIQLYEKRIQSYTEIAAKYAEQAIYATPDNNEFHNILAKLRGIRPEYELVSWRMFVFYQEFIKKYPDNNTALTKLHRAYVQSNNYEEAIEINEKITDERIRVILKSDMLIRLGKKEEALIILDKLAADYANDPDVLYDVGERYDRANQFDKALDLFEKSFDLLPEPKFLQSLYSRAFMYDRTGNYEKAIEMWEEIIVRLKRDWHDEDLDWANDMVEVLKNKIAQR